MYEYSLKKSSLNGEQDKFVAVVQNGKKISIEEMVDDIAIPSSILKKTEIVAVANVLFEEITKNIRKGIGFTSEHLQTSVSIKGTFDSEDDRFDKDRHKTKINFTPGPTVKKMVGEISVEKIKPVAIIPVVNKFIDAATDIANETITPNSPAKILGDRLKVDGEDPTQGIFFTDTNGNETKVTLIVHNMPSQLIFMVPALPAGTYRVHVRAMINDAEVREGTLPTSLTVG